MKSALLPLVLLVLAQLWTPARSFLSTDAMAILTKTTTTTTPPTTLSSSGVDNDQTTNGVSLNDMELLKSVLTGSNVVPSTTVTGDRSGQDTPPLGLTTEQIAELKAFLQSDLNPFERDEYWNDVNQHVTQATTMPPEAFRSPQFFQVEQEKLFAKTWQVAAFTDQLREPGDIVTANIAGQPVLLTKGRDGEIRGFFNVCRHRGARLVKNPTECGKKSIACPYHNWGYSLDGRLMGTPLWGKENKVPDEILAERLEASGTKNDIENFDKADFGLLPVRVQTWGPFVYANLSGDAPPLEEYLGRVTTDLELYPFEGFVTVRSDDLYIKANWKLLAENFMVGHPYPWFNFSALS